MPTDTTLSGQFGRYRILRKLGAGGMGSVYLAEDSLLGRQVALKVPHFDEGASGTIIERFYREARVAAAIDHPNLCPVHDVGQIDGTHYLSMPYIEGTPLAQQVNPEQPWPPRRAAELVSRLARALQAMHDRGLIHRDLKPGNVLIRPSGEPVLMDFGLARSFTNESQRLTATGTAIGTPSYMAPEQVLGDTKSIGPATDVYSLGMILYELVTGTLPFVGRMDMVFAQILHATPETPSARRRGLDRSLDAICLKAMAKQPEDRHASAADLAATLERYSQGGGIEPVAGPNVPKRTAVPTAPLPVVSLAPPEETVPPAPRLEPTTADRQAQPRRRVLSPLYLAGTALLLLFVLAVWLLLGGAGKGDPDNRTAATDKTDTHTPPNPGPAQEEDKPAPPARDPGLPPKRITNSIGMKLVLIPAGTFQMGSPETEVGRFANEGPQHEVEITRPFYMGVYEVTQQQYERVIGKNPSGFSATGLWKDQVVGMDTRRFPVETVSWEEATEFCRKLSELPEEKNQGRLYRLPTEAEWEYSCRGGANASTPFHYGNSLSSKQANFYGNSPYGGAAKGPYLDRTTTVGSYQPNAFGLYDMHGNVWEWCHDWYDQDYYNQTPRQNPQGPQNGDRRVLRGGSWYVNGRDCRSATRGGNVPGDRGNNGGFRVVCSAGVRTP